MLNEEIKADLKRAKEAFESAERNFRTGDYLTAANRELCKIAQSSLTRSLKEQNLAVLEVASFVE